MGSLKPDLLAGQSAKQKRAQHDKENVGKPDQQLWMHVRVAAQGIANDDKEKIAGSNNQTHGEAN